MQQNLYNPLELARNINERNGNICEEIDVSFEIRLENRTGFLGFIDHLRETRFRSEDSFGCRGC